MTSEPTFTEQRYQCPCCGYYTLSGRGKDNICKVCFWQDDEPAEVFGQPAPKRPTGPNHVHLWRARENFLAFGASEKRFRDFVRPPRDAELRPSGEDTHE
jgi:hypothetical protein